jgi:hypothetical protein
MASVSMRQILPAIAATLSLAAFLCFAGPAPTRAGDRPDPQMTPGDVLPVTQAQVCQPDYGHDIGPIPQRRAEQVLLAYGLLSTDPGAYKIDHLIPLALGGSNAITNLWPLSRNGEPWNAYVKDVFERKLRVMICQGNLPLAEVQAALAKDWIAAYWRWIGE